MMGNPLNVEADGLENMDKENPIVVLGGEVRAEIQLMVL